jgi:hypothetical protein
MHYVKTSALRTLVLDAIKRASGFVRGNTEEFISLVREASELQSAEEAKARKEKISKNEKRRSELDGIIKHLYEDKLKGELSPKRFEILSGEYEAEQEELEKQIDGLKTGLEQFNDDGDRAAKFAELARRYTDFTELTAAMLNEFVDKIFVHEAERANGRRTQKVEIYLNFIGRFDVPGYEEPIPEETDPAERQRAIWRDYYHRNRDKINGRKAERAEKAREAKQSAIPVRAPMEIAAEMEAKKQRHRAYQREYQKKWRDRRKLSKDEPVRTALN